MKCSQASLKKAAIVLNCPSNITSHGRYDEFLYETQIRFLDCDVRLARNAPAAFDDAQNLNNINTLAEQLAIFDQEGYKQVIIVPVYLLPSEEYIQTKATVERFNQTNGVDLSTPPTHDRFCMVSFSDIKEMFWHRIRNNLASLEST
jgi:cobalamin biosynthesis Co2+ chelatase CbiK